MIIIACDPPAMVVLAHRLWVRQLPVRVCLRLLRYTNTALTRRLTSFSSVSPSFEKMELVCFSTARSDNLQGGGDGCIALP